MSITVRPACPGDAQALIRLNEAFNGVTGLSPADVQRSLASSGEIVVLTEEDGQAVGFACAQVHRSFCYPAPVAEITEMYVDEACRGQGCAGQMLAFLEEHLITCFGVDEIHLLTGTDNASAQAAYLKAGFRLKNEAYMCKDVRRNR